MWSSPAELYPIHIAPTQAVQGQGYVIEPQVEYQEQDYLIVQPSGKPYELHQNYARRLWVC